MLKKLKTIKKANGHTFTLRTFTFHIFKHVVKLRERIGSFIDYRLSIIDIFSLELT